MRVALVTGGSRGIGKGIVQALLETKEYDGYLIVYNTNKEAAEVFAKEIVEAKVVIVGGDLTEVATRDRIFDVFDEEFQDAELCAVVHNAGQYVGVTSSNSNDLEQGKFRFGDGSLLDSESGKPNFDFLHYYQKLYSEAWIDLCERSLVRMKGCKAADPDNYRGSIVGISSPGCNTHFKMTPGYDMPGSGKCVMEFSVRQYALAAAPYSINCNVVIPGFTRSDAWSKLAEQRGAERDAMMEMFVKKAVPAGEVIEAKELGDVVAFLAGPKGGRFITGMSIRVDGGLHLGK